LGHLQHDYYDDKWFGTVYIPVGYTENQLEKLERILTMKVENEIQIKRNEKHTDKLIIKFKKPACFY